MYLLDSQICIRGTLYRDNETLTSAAAQHSNVNVTGGRNAPEWVVDLLRNQWPESSGICNLQIFPPVSREAIAAI